MIEAPDASAVGCTTCGVAASPVPFVGSAGRVPCPGSEAIRFTSSTLGACSCSLASVNTPPSSYTIKASSSCASSASEDAACARVRACGERPGRRMIRRAGRAGAAFARGCRGCWRL
eukprot:193601-Prymnesium_polylepis.1